MYTNRLVAAFIACVLPGCLLYAMEYGALTDYYGFEQMEIIRLDDGIGNLIMADFNGNGAKDLAIVNNRQSKIEILLQGDKIAPMEQRQTVGQSDRNVNELVPMSRFVRQSIAVSHRITSMVSGDFNGNGKTDIAYYGEPEGLYVLYQQPQDSDDDMATIRWQRRPRIDITDALKTMSAMVAADINGNGRDDIIVASRDAVYFVTQQEDGTLAEPLKYPASTGIYAVHAADIDGDGNIDLALLSHGGENPLLVRFGTGTGQFGPQVEYSIETPGPLRFADITNDGADELLMIDSRTRRLVCYKLVSDEQTQPNWPVWVYPLRSEGQSSRRDMVIADVTGNGLEDVVISDPDAAELMLFKQLEGLGLAEPVLFPAYSDIRHISAADISGNGKAELVVLSIDEKVVGLSEYKDERLVFPQTIDLVGEPLAMDVADMNNSGMVDCVYVSRTPGQNVYSMRIKYDLVKGRAQSDEDSWELAGLRGNPDRIALVDVDQDGLMDVLVFMPYGEPVVMRQSSLGEFERIESQRAQMSLIRQATARTTAVADIDGSGSKELLVAQNNYARSLIFEDGQRWAVLDQYNARSGQDEVLAVAAFNLYDTAQPDVLLLDRRGRLQILRADEDATYRLAEQVEIGSFSAGSNLRMFYADLGPQGRRSVVIFDGEKFAVVTPPVGNEGRRHMQQHFNYETLIRDGAYGNFTVADINSSNTADIIAVDTGGNNFEILALDGNHQPVPALRFKIFEEKQYEQSRSGSTVEPRELLTGDVTNNGKTDLVTVIHDRIIIYPQH